MQWCRNPGGGRQYKEGVSTAEEEAMKTVVHLRLAGWRELQAVFQDAEKHWKQLEEQQVVARQIIRSKQGRGPSSGAQDSLLVLVPLMVCSSVLVLLLLPSLSALALSLASSSRFVAAGQGQGSWTQITWLPGLGATG
ncbi:hypothetical protein AOLI_G00138800 [Acnodon oligacanthus]